MKNDYEIRGDVTVIFLDRKDGSRLECLIDTDDLPRAMEFPWKWSPHWNPQTESFYAEGKTYHKRNPDGTDAKREHYELHRWLYLPLPKTVEVDHINHDTLDNRRSSNLRVLPKGMNQQNYKGARKDSSSGIRGVRKTHMEGKWKAAIKVNKIEYCLGYFTDLKEAERVVTAARARMMPYSLEALNKEAYM